MKNFKLLFVAMLFIAACGDDEETQFCSSCSDDNRSEEICADSQTELESKTDAFLDDVSGVGICIDKQ